MKKPRRLWTEEEEKRLVEIVDVLSVPYNWWKAGAELKRSANACKKRYWLIKDRETGKI